MVNTPSCGQNSTVVYMPLMKSFADIITHQLEAKNASPITTALQAGLNRDAIRSVLRGRVPSIERAFEICSALDLEFYIGPPRSAAGADKAAFSPIIGKIRQPESFAATHTLPVIGWASCSIQGVMESELALPDMPAPASIAGNNSNAFYAIVTGRSMEREGIAPGNYCLIEPDMRLVPGDRVWIKDHNGKTNLKRLLAIEEDGSLRLRGWFDDEAPARQRFIMQSWLVGNYRTGVVRGVWRGKPDVNSPPEFVPDPEPFGGMPKEICDLLGMKIDVMPGEVVAAIRKLLVHAGNGKHPPQLSHTALYHTDMVSLEMAKLCAVIKAEIKAEIIKEMESRVRQEIRDKIRKGLKDNLS